MQKKQKKTSASPRRNSATADLLDGLAELESYAARGLTIGQVARELGRQHPERVRVAFVAPKPGKYPPGKVRRLREAMGMSQATFAQVIGVSRILVQSWERGMRIPSPLAARLLDTISADPWRWLENLQSGSLSRRRGSTRRAG